MRKRIATRAVALTLGSADAALAYHAWQHSHPAVPDSRPDIKPPHGAIPEEVHAPEASAPPWAEEVHALLHDQLWELQEEARVARRAGCVEQQRTQHRRDAGDQ